MVDGGTEAFPGLGKHCQHSDCYQLDFLPFNCDGCRKVFCLDHRSYKSHECPRAYFNSRTVIICEICSESIETTGKDREEEVKKIIEIHEKSKDCDPSKKRKPRCPVRRCKQVLTFSNNCTCKICQVKVCLAHRFPADHACKGSASGVVSGERGAAIGNKFLIALARRSAKDCATSSISKSSASNSSSPIPSVKAC